METADVGSITTALADLIGDQLQAVTFKWVARHFNIPYDTSKRVLFDFLTKQGQKVCACFLLSGWTSDDTPRHVVRVVDGGGLEDAKAAMSVITALHVYSVQPSALKDVNKLQNSDYAQTEELFRKMMASAADPSPLSTNLLSTVRYSAAKRDASLVRPAPKKPPSSAVAAPSKVSAPAKSAAPAPSAPKPSIFAASSKASQGKAKASTAAAVGSTKNNPKETKKPAAASKKPSNAPAAVIDDNDNDGDDEEMPAVSRPTKGKRVAIDDSESEEDVPPAKQAKVEKKSASATAKSTKGGAGAAGKKQSGGGKRKKETEEEKEEVEKPSEPAPKYGTVKVHIDAPSGKRTRRVMKSYFNDAGEEVTEMVDETDDEAPPPSAAAAPSAPAPARAPAPKPAPSSKPSGGSKKGGKGAAAAGQRSIASFFGKS